MLKFTGQFKLTDANKFLAEKKLGRYIDELKVEYENKEFLLMCEYDHNVIKVKSDDYNVAVQMVYNTLKRLYVKVRHKTRLAHEAKAKHYKWNAYKEYLKPLPSNAREEEVD